MPTITDANLLLGRLNPTFFLGGEIALDPEASRTALLTRCAQPLGLNLFQAASGIIEIANAHMMGAMRLVSVQRGYDPRQFVLVAFGGAGPLHANALAQALNIPTVLIPPSPGIASALGMLMTDIQHAFVATRQQVLSSLQPQALAALFREFETEGETLLTREGIAPQQRRLLRSIDLRYQGQSHELSVPVPAGSLTAQHLHNLQEQFHAVHARTYGYDARDDAVELVNIRLTAVGSSPKPCFPTLSQGSAEATHAVKAQRPVWFSETANFIDCTVVDRSRLLCGNVVPGPAVVEELDPPR